MRVMLGFGLVGGLRVGVVRGYTRVVAEVGVGAVQHGKVGLEDGISVLSWINGEYCCVGLPCLRRRRRYMLALLCARHHLADVHCGPLAGSDA